MNPRFGRRSWIKLWVNEWLDGTTRYDMTGAQRAFWVDLLAMAGRSRFPGIICAGQTEGRFVGYPLAKFQGLLTEPISVEETLTLFEKTGKIEIEITSEAPVKLYKVSLVNWDRYQSEYQRQRKYRQKDRGVAYQRIFNAVQRGELVKSPTCQSCGKKKPLEAHHHKGYSEEHILDVLWLCKRCHEEAHARRLRKGDSLGDNIGHMTEVEVEGDTDTEGEGEKSAPQPSAPPLPAPLEQLNIEEQVKILATSKTIPVLGEHERPLGEAGQYLPKPTSERRAKKEHYRSPAQVEREAAKRDAPREFKTFDQMRAERTAAAIEEDRQRDELLAKKEKT